MAGESQAVTLDELTRELFDDANFPVVATANAQGWLASAVVWFTRDEETLLFVTGRTSPKARNIADNPRVSISVHDRENPYRASEVRGTAEFTDDDPVALLNQLAYKYLGQSEYSDSDPSETVAIRVRPTKVLPFSG
jgi:PPOX class probable F420-dependent enzyme